jgi:hypothetical protein
MRWLRVLRSMKEKAGRAEDRAASTRFRVIHTTQPTVRALRAGRCSKRGGINVPRPALSSSVKVNNKSLQPTPNCRPICDEIQ